MKLRNKKTGEIADVKIDTYNENGKGDRICLSVRDGEDLYRCIASYPSLAELNAEWEDYVPQEPLIKDEKIRKAVRAWAEALGTDEVSYNSCAEYSEGRFEAEMGMADIDFGRVLDLKDGSYTITELCGEEE